MSPSHTHIWRTGTAILAIAASLAAAPAAQAATGLPPDRADGLGGANAASHAAAVVPPDRADGLGRAVFGPATVTLPPDREDGVGSSRFVQAPAPTVILQETPSGFDWTSAAIGAVLGLGLGLVAMAGMMARGRRDAVAPS